MKRFLRKLIFAIVIITGIVAFLNINVTTKQGINYQWHTIRIPLYLKILDFFDRHYNYEELVKRIVKDADTDEERIIKIFEWTHQNIRKTPEGFPIIDDHVWHTIVRGYGVSDQSSDVFTTLCNYAGLDAFYTCVYAVDRTRNIPLSFVKIEGRWSIFDPYYGCYFKNKNAETIDIEGLKSKGTWFIECLDGKPDINYALYFDNLPSVKDIGLTRANTQSPLNRLFFELKRLKRK